MKGLYQVKKGRLEQLHGEAKNIVSQFQSFSIRHCVNVNSISSDLLYGAMPIQGFYVKDYLVLRSSPSIFIDGYCNISLICVFFSYTCVIFNDHVFFQF